MITVSPNHLRINISDDAIRALLWHATAKKDVALANDCNLVLKRGNGFIRIVRKLCRMFPDEILVKNLLEGDVV